MQYIQNFATCDRRVVYELQIRKNVSCFTLSCAEYMNQNGCSKSDMANPNYQHPGPPRSTLSIEALDETEEEYLNYFKEPAGATAEASASAAPTTTTTTTIAAPEYLNTSQNGLLSLSSSSGALMDQPQFNPQNSMDNPDYQQDFCPLALAKPKLNGHLPAAENVEYLGLAGPLEVH